MSKAQVHFVNVHPGDCTIIKHASGHVTMIDICDGNEATVDSIPFKELSLEKSGVNGNFGMCNHNTNPIDYLNSLNINSIFRFILTHPDMDHMDGFNRLVDEIKLTNYWDSTFRRDKPDFAAGPYLEEDWDRYEKVRDGKEEGVTVVTPLAGASFKFANRNENGESGGDALIILAPDKGLLNDLDKSDDINDGSYVILYNSLGGKVLICGDAHDKTFEYIKDNHLELVKDVTILLAPHHGRHSNRSYDFLDFINPKLTIIGCAPCQHIDYSQWSRRDLDILTSNQAGNIVLEIDDKVIDVYVENEIFAKKHDPNPLTNRQGFFGLWRYKK